MHRITRPQNRIVHEGRRQCVGQEGDHAVDAVFQGQAQGLIQQHDLRPHVGEQHLEEDRFSTVATHIGTPTLVPWYSILKQK